MAARFPEGSLGELMEFLLPRIQADLECPTWPPDVFALSAAVLLKTGAYSYVVQNWPPSTTAATQEKWLDVVVKTADEWHAKCDQKPPEIVVKWWSEILGSMDMPLQQIGKESRMCEALLQMCSVADEASAGVGINGAHDLFRKKSLDRLLDKQNGSSLCKEVHWSKLRVLPKQHAPRSGITIRSISHHLALCVTTDVTPYWHIAPADETLARDPALQPESPGLNLLLVPWPQTVVPAQFSSSEPTYGQLRNMDDGFGFFEFQSERDETSPVEFSQRILQLVQKARSVAGNIDGLILPELALSHDQHQVLSEMLMTENMFLVSGIGAKGASAGYPGENYLAINVPWLITSKSRGVEILQSKHHRWRLDRNQILQYGLGARLSPTREWWEHISLSERSINFVNLRDWCTLCVLVCEDLARPDPVGDIVRAVGPTLVVALLMDGPQLGARWPGRYATVLADDPGCSVLTLSSAGMVNLSRPLSGGARSRSIGLWKDARSPNATEIELPNNAQAVVISLSCDKITEITADGRSDGGQTPYPVLAGLHPISL